MEAKLDTSLFIYRYGADTIHLSFYIDDIVLTASSPKLLQCTTTALQREFVMKDLGPFHHFLGVSLEQRHDNLFLHQCQYTWDILECASMSDCKLYTTLVDTQATVSSDIGIVSDLPAYRCLARALRYHTFTRPDISCAVQ
jgi:hypothetical protein